jgi:hypothetical protein
VRIRGFGWLASRYRTEPAARCPALLEGSVEGGVTPTRAAAGEDCSAVSKWASWDCSMVPGECEVGRVEWIDTESG